RQHGARQHGARQHGARQRRAGQVEALLETVGLAGFGRRYPHQLSGGQQQRVALARALAIEPAVVLLDEPFASLDAHLRASVRADVQEIFRRAGTTAVLVTHDQDEALSVADRVAVLRDGRIAQCAPPEDLYRRPADPRLAGFIGDANLVEGVVSGSMVKTLLGCLPLDPAAVIPGSAGQVTVLIRPEQIDIVPNEDGLTAHVTSYRYHGHDAVLYVQPEDDAGAQPVMVRITGGPHRPAGPQLSAGTAVTLRARGPVFAWLVD
ncbi:MAG TPA: ABC transporter ATP-binding protein, partial [Streptosporangiaceae bacterium]|nr:ABC transporter ATP-binding protein [Streptosporangiaceae bacterium]